MRAILAALISMFLLVASAAQADLPGLYKVSSTFHDLSDAGWDLITGTGILVTYDSPPGNSHGLGRRFFILTVGHVSQGQNIRIEIGGRPAVIKENGLARLANNTFDVEWIEIEDPHVADTAFSLVSPCQGMPFMNEPDEHPGPGQEFCINGSRVSLNRWNDWSDSSLYPRLKPGRHVLDLDGHQQDADILVKQIFDQGSTINTQTASDAESGAGNFTAALIPLWTDRSRADDARLKSYSPEIIPTQTDTNEEIHSLGETAYGGEYNVIARVKEGMSGAPVLSVQASNADLHDLNSLPYRVVGLVKGFDRRFETSQIVSEDIILDVFKHYMGGQRGLDDATVLVHDHCLTYRKYGNGLLEVHPLTSPSGNGEHGDGGNGEHGDGGNGEHGDGGNGEHGDGGRCLVSAISGRGWSALYGIGPGLAYQPSSSQPAIGIIALRIKSTDKVLLAETSAANATLKLGLDKFDMIPEGSPLVPLLYLKTLHPSGLPVELDARGDSRLHIVRSRLSFDESSAVVKIVLDVADPDVLLLHFSKDGTCLESGLHHFEPLVEVASQEHPNNHYLIDLRQFFFTDLSMVPLHPYLKNSAHYPVISVRKVGNQDDQFSLVFRNEVGP